VRGYQISLAALLGIFSAASMAKALAQLAAPRVGFAGLAIGWRFALTGFVLILFHSVLVAVHMYRSEPALRKFLRTLVVLTSFAPVPVLIAVAVWNFTDVWYWR